jgi:hypothetical protein
MMCNIIRLTFDCGHENKQEQLCKPPCETGAQWTQHKRGKCSKFERARPPQFEARHRETSVDDIELGCPTPYLTPKTLLHSGEGQPPGGYNQLDSEQVRLDSKLVRTDLLYRLYVYR